MIDLYRDRNHKEKTITNSFIALSMYINKNKNNKIQHIWGKILNSNNKIAIMYSAKSRTKLDTYFRDTIQKYYTNVLIIERGYINRNKYYSLSWNEQGGKATVKPKNCNDKRLKELNINIKPIKKNKDGYIY